MRVFIHSCSRFIQQQYLRVHANQVSPLDGFSKLVDAIDSRLEARPKLLEGPGHSHAGELTKRPPTGQSELSSVAPISGNVSFPLAWQRKTYDVSGVVSWINQSIMEVNLKWNNDSASSID